MTENKCTELKPMTENKFVELKSMALALQQQQDKEYLDREAKMREHAMYWINRAISKKCTSTDINGLGDYPKIINEIIEAGFEYTGTNTFEHDKTIRVFIYKQRGADNADV